MDNGLILIITFSIPLLLLVVYYIWLYNRKKRHADTLKSDWIKFKKAINHKHINGILNYGTELVWNECLTDSQLKEMKEHIDELIAENPKLKHLKNIIHNKYLNWNKDYVGTA